MAFYNYSNRTKWSWCYFNRIYIYKYNNNNQLLSTDVFDSDEIIDRFDTNYVSAFSSIDHDLARANNTNGINYVIISVEGIEEKNGPVSAEARI